MGTDAGMGMGQLCPGICAIQNSSFVRVSAQFHAYTGAYTDVVGITALYKDVIKGRDSAKGLSGGMWYEDHLSPGTLEARADGTVQTMVFPVFSAGQWAVTRMVQ